MDKYADREIARGQCWTSPNAVFPDLYLCPFSHVSHHRLYVCIVVISIPACLPYQTVSSFMVGSSSMFGSFLEPEIVPIGPSGDEQLLMK